MELKYIFKENWPSHEMVVLIPIQCVCSLHIYKIDIQEGNFLKKRYYGHGPTNGARCMWKDLMLVELYPVNFLST